MCRTPIPVDWTRVDELLEAGCLGTEIAAYYAMHPHTFYDKVANKYKMTFTEYLQQKRSKGNSILREAQYKKAVKKLDNSMLIWLGKQRLDQKENVNEMHVSDEIVKPFLAVMQQLAGLQADRKTKESKESTEARSE